MVQDASAAIELLLPTGASVPPVGTGIRAVGRSVSPMGRPGSGPSGSSRSQAGGSRDPLVLHAQPNVAHEWRLVTITGRIESVHKLGDRWRAELLVGSRQVPIVGQPGSGIAATALVEGRIATVVGIVRRPFPTATDRRFAILPRSAADLRVEGGAIARGRARGADPASAGTIGPPGPAPERRGPGPPTRPRTRPVPI